jgi:hypothetical protein
VIKSKIERRALFSCCDAKPIKDSELGSGLFPRPVGVVAWNSRQQLIIVWQYQHRDDTYQFSVSGQRVLPVPDEEARTISTALITAYRTTLLPHTHTHILPTAITLIMALDSFFHNKIESMKLEIIQGQAVLRRLEAQRNDYNSRGNDGSYPSRSSPS